jgi:predicted small lipoprotein YifL
LDPRFVRIAAIGALVCALGLAGCGRKGGLDPPPGAQAVGEPPPGGQSIGGPVGTNAAPNGPDGRALPPDVPRRRTPIDFLID